MKKFLVITLFLISTLLGTGCGSSEAAGGIPKSRFLATGETRPILSEEEKDYYVYDSRGRILAPVDHYRTESDRRLIHRIRNSFDENPRLSNASDQISITADEGDIWLHGSVPTEREKAVAGRDAKKIAGPDNVTNKLLVNGYEG